MVLFEVRKFSGKNLTELNFGITTINDQREASPIPSDLEVGIYEDIGTNRA